MQDNTKNIALSLLIRPYKGRYIAICKEPGLIREANTFEEAHKSIFTSLSTLAKEVEKDPNAIESFKVGLSFSMLLFFYFSVLKFQFIRMHKAVTDIIFLQGNSNNLH